MFPEGPITGVERVVIRIGVVFILVVVLSALGCEDIIPFTILECE